MGRSPYHGAKWPDADNDLKRLRDQIKDLQSEIRDLPKPEEKKKKKYQTTLLFNLFAGPGAGKSSIAFDLMGKLKWNGVDCEFASEYAKDLVWEKRHKTFEDQIYIFGKQFHRVSRLIGEVEVIVTDSPILLTIVYGEKWPALCQLAQDEHVKLNNVNIFVNRKKTYNPNGRNHTLKESIVIDKKIKNLLELNRYEYSEVDGDPAGACNAFEVVKRML